MNFEFYVLNYNSNKREVEPFNIFDNIFVEERTEKEVKKYLRSPKNYTTTKRDIDNKIVTLVGFEAFCENLRSIIMCEEWSRFEYEMSVGYPFEDNADNLKKIDCYYQALPNMPIIAREVIYQAKEQSKNKK